MASLDIVVPATGVRRWQAETIEALKADGHDVRVVKGPHGDAWPGPVELLIKAEGFASRSASRLHDRMDIEAEENRFDPMRQRLDLCGGDGGFKLLFDGNSSASKAAAALIAGRRPELTITSPFGTLMAARPMVDSRAFISRGLDDVLARAITMLRAFAAHIDHYAATKPQTLPRRDASHAQSDSGTLIWDIAGELAPRLARQILHRSRHHAAHWRVGYRFHDGRGVAETGLLSGPVWSELPDDGQRFYADPFPFEHQGRHFIFVEEFPHHTGKGIISVAEFNAEGKPSIPRPVLEQPFHLSYPQVFRHGSEIFMLPEGGAGGELVLYKATSFPDGWTRHATLVSNRELYDATLLQHGGRHWLFATERDGRGSSSDTLVVFHAPKLSGPWRPHKRNPIAIDLASARPGGAFIKIDGRVIRPVQDGTLGYGGGLGLSDLIQLDKDVVNFTRPVPILSASNWPYPRVHTLNRAGRLEVIDGIADARNKAYAA